MGRGNGGRRWLLDRFHQAGHVTDGYAILFGICASAYLVSFVIHHVLSPRLEPLAIDR